MYLIIENDFLNCRLVLNKQGFGFVVQYIHFLQSSVRTHVIKV